MTEGPTQEPSFPVRVDVRVGVSVGGLAVRIEARVPDRPVRLDELLPALRAMDDRLIDEAVARLEATGERISCAKGCSACPRPGSDAADRPFVCRQYLVTSPPDLCAAVARAFGSPSSGGP
ncbi:MAG: hypothetical protein ABI768_12920 [Acidobacteriota bacterium]